MINSRPVLGLVSHALYVADERRTAQDLSEMSGQSVDRIIDLGFSRIKGVPDEEEQPVSMAVFAIRQALVKARPDINPKDIDLVIWAGDGYQDYAGQPAAARIIQELSCSGAWGINLADQSTALIQALNIANVSVMTDSNIDTVLIASGSRQIDLIDPANPDTVFMLGAAASGGAMILKRGHQANVLLNTSFCTDPELIHDIYILGGGSETDGSDSSKRTFQVARPKAVEEYLSNRLPPTLAQIIISACQDQTPDHLALGHLSPVMRSDLLNRLGLGNDQSVPLFMWGDHGNLGPLLALELAIHAQAMTEGMTVCLASAGIGFNYAAAVFKWGNPT